MVQQTPRNRTVHNRLKINSYKKKKRGNLYLLLVLKAKDKNVVNVFS